MVPCKEPVIPPNTFKEPVICTKVPDTNNEPVICSSLKEIIPFLATNWLVAIYVVPWFTVPKAWVYSNKYLG